MRVAITGASGWLGSAAVAVAEQAGHEVIRFASAERPGYHPLGALVDTPHDVLLHYACVTRERIADAGHDGYVVANVEISNTVCAAISRYQPQVFFASSGAARAPGDLADDPYGALKRMDEHLLRDASDRRCAIVRVFSVAGPYVQKLDTFALADLLRQQVRGARAFSIRANRPVVRSFVDVEDLAAFALATAGEDIRVDAAGAEAIEVGDLARRIDPGLAHDRPERDQTLAPDRYVGDHDQFARACLRYGVSLRDLDEQIARTRHAVVGLCQAAARTSDG